MEITLPHNDAIQTASNLSDHSPLFNDEGLLGLWSLGVEQDADGTGEVFEAFFSIDDGSTFVAVNVEDVPGVIIESDEVVNAFETDWSEARGGMSFWTSDEGRAITCF